MPQQFKGFDPTRTQTDPTTYTAAAIAAQLGVDESTIRNRWWPKLSEAFKHCPEPVRVVVRHTKTGSPVYEFTTLGLKAFKAYKQDKDAGQEQDFLVRIAKKYPAPTPETEVITGELITDIVPATTPKLSLDQDALALVKIDQIADLEAAQEGHQNLLELRANRQQAIQRIARLHGTQDYIDYMRERDRALTQLLQQNDQNSLNDLLGK